MKKYFLSLVAMAAMLFATSCQESLVEPQIEGPTTFTVQVPDAMGTKAFGEASAVKQLLVEVYPQNDESVIYQTVEQGNGQFEVSLNLIQDQAYDILFWAQTTNGYVVVSGNETDGYSFGSLRNVPMNSNYLNNDNGAAFFHAEKGFVPNGTSTTITLVRPFAQLNLGTTPASLITDAGEYELVSSAITVTGMANSFNVFSGEGFGDAVATYSFTTQEVPAESEVLSAANATYKYVSMNYLSVLGNEKALVDIDATIVVRKGNEVKTIKHSFTSVPVQENYRTNIVGNLISSTTDFNVVVDDRFVDENNNPNPDNDYFVVDNVAEAHNALLAGETYIAINSIRNGESVLELDYTSNTTLYIQLPDTDATLTVQGANVKELYLSVPDTNPTNRGLALVINTPNAHVELDGNGGFFQSIVATTSNNTLVLNGVNVLEVEVVQGNVEAINETEVQSLKRTDNNIDANTIVTVDENSQVNIATEQPVGQEDKIQVLGEGVSFVDGEYLISNANGLRWFAESVDNGNTYDGKTIKLTADIDLSENNWNPIGDNRTDKAFSGTFDGQNHIITGAHITGDHCFNGAVYGSTEGWGLFSVVDGATIKKLKVDGATFGSYTVISGTIAGYANNTTFENIEITNTKIAGYNWYTGGVVGWAAGECTFDGINLDNTVAVGTLWDSHGQNAGGIAGGVSASATITIENCNIACVLDVINDVTSNYKWYIYRVSGMIIGNTNTTETKYNEVVTATATNVTCKNVTVTYGKWMNYHYCEGYWNRGWGRYESSDYVGGADQEETHNHADGEEHLVTIPFDQLFGGSSNGSGHYPVKGLAEFPGVTVIYPAEYTCDVCGKQHNVVLAGN